MHGDTKFYVITFYTDCALQIYVSWLCGNIKKHENNNFKKYSIKNVLKNVAGVLLYI